MISASPTSSGASGRLRSPLVSARSAAGSQRADRGGGLVPFRAVCDCPSGRRRPPVRLNRSFARTLVETMPGHQHLGTYKCGDCGGIVILTVGAVDLTAPATSPT